MKILHISDLHHNGADNKNIPFLIEELSLESIDICIFTGDLVDKFMYPLSKGYNYLKSELSKIGDFPLFITCGNHDIDRSKATKMFKSYIQNELSTTELLNTFVKDNEGGMFLSNLSHIKGYNDLICNEYPNDDCSDLYSIHNVEIEEKTISIVSLNLSWTAYNTSNYGTIVFPDYIMMEITKKIKQSDVKLLITHFDPNFLHPDFQKKFNAYLLNNFDSIFVGHTHERDSFELNFAYNGIFSSTASMLKNEKTTNRMGFKLLDFDLNDYTVKIANYNINNGQLDKSYDTFSIPTDESKKSQIKLHSSIVARKEILIEDSNRLFLMNRDNSDLVFKDVFVEPELKSNSYTDLALNDREISKEKNMPTLELLKDINYIIFGKDKSGKSSLLYKVAIDLLENFDRYNTLPILIDLYDSHHEDILNVEKVVRNQYNLSHKEFEKIQDKLCIKVLVDNYSTDSKEVNRVFFSTIDNQCMKLNLSFLMTSSTQIDSDFVVLSDSIECRRLFIHTISRKSIRELTNKWPLRCNQEDAMEKITQILSAMNIGFNFWTVSMFLFILEKTEDFKVRNSSELIELYVEKILDKEKLILTNRELSYESFKVYLSELAFFLFKEKADNNYKASYIDLLNCYSELKKKNIRIVADSKIVIEYLIDHGMLVNTNCDQYSFRMRGLFEYFLAYYMFRNDEFKNEILSNYQNYIAFGNEIELYSGMKKNDSKMLSHLFEALQLLKSEVQIKMSKEHDFEEIIKEKNEKISNIMEIANHLKETIEPLSLDVQDEIDDNADPLDGLNTKLVVKKQAQINSYSDYMNCVNVLGRAFRNMDDISDTELLKTIFRYLLNESCLSIYYVVQEFLKENGEGLVKEKQIKEFEKFMLAFAPLLAHSMLYEMISHPTISNLIKEEIELLKNDEGSHDVKLFVLYFMLIETNIHDEINKVEELIETIKYWNVHNSTFFKLLSYVAFKTSGDEITLTKLKKNIDLVYKKLYPNAKLGSVSGMIEDLKTKGRAELPSESFDIS